MILYIDFDRTLFNTSQFAADRDAVLESQFGVVISPSDAKKFYRFVDDLYDYDFYEHMASYGLSMADIVGPLKQGLKSVRSSYVYDDAKPIIDSFQFTVLTFGRDDYQTFKFDFAPELTDKEKVIVFEHKDQYIERIHQSGERVVLVDDKPEAARAHPAVDFIHLDRNSKQAICRNDFGYSINSLTQLPELLKHY